MTRDETLAILESHREEIKSLRVKSLSIFGSVARDEAGPDSDVDVLVEFNRPAGLFAVVRLQRYLESILGTKVDLATPGALRPHMREHILKEAIRAA